MRYLIGISLIFMLYAAEGYAQPSCVGDTVSVYFSQNRAMLEFYIPENRQAFTRLDSVLRETGRDIKLDSIVITAAASPDGSPEFNKHLSQRRASALVTHLRTSYPQSVGWPIHTHITGADWEGLRSLASQDSRLPGREELLSLIDSSLPEAEKERRLRRINDGATFAYVRQHFLANLRKGMVCVIYYREAEPYEEVRSAEPAGEEPMFEKVTVSDEPFQQQERLFLPDKTHKPFPAVALKTNMLFDLASLINVEAEVPIGKRWSINAEYMFPWWQWRNRHYTVQTISGSAEGRYWLGNRSENGLLEGFFVGAYAGGGYYDFQLGGDGYQGEFYIALGAGAGYAHRIGKRLGLEYSIGIGYLHTRYRRYSPMDGCKVWQEDGRWSYLGPTKVKVSLVWMLGDKKRWQR